MMTLHHELTTEKQIDRACSAQSNEMLPKFPPSPEEIEAQKAQLQARINAQFEM